MEERRDAQVDELVAAQAETAAQGNGQKADVDRMIECVLVVILNIRQPKMKVSLSV
jgi:hypothetical protein